MFSISNWLCTCFWVGLLSNKLCLFAPLLANKTLSSKQYSMLYRMFMRQRELKASVPQTMQAENQKCLIQISRVVYKGNCGDPTGYKVTGKLRVTFLCFLPKQTQCA